MTNSSVQPRSNRVDSYLKAQLNSRTLAAIPTHQIQEVIVTLKEKITSIPNMPDCVLGLVNQRNRIYWIVDLVQLLDLTAKKLEMREYHLIFIRVSDLVLGLAVQAIKEVTKFAPEEIQSPSNLVNSSLVSYLQRTIQEQQNTILFLEVSAIVNSPYLKGV